VTGGDDIAGLDRSYTRLHSFLRGCPDPTTRAYAAARFLSEIAPRPFTGRSYYFESLAPELLAAVKSSGFQVLDPEVSSVIRAGLLALGPEGESVAAAVFDAPGGPAEDPLNLAKAGAKGAASVPEATAEISVPVCQQPPPPAPGLPVVDVGVLASFSIKPRPIDKGHPDLRWSAHPDAADDPMLRPLHAVARDAFEAARRVVPRASRLGFDLDVSGIAAPVAGDSAGLGLAVAMAGAMIAAGSANGIASRWRNQDGARGTITHSPARASGLRPRSNLAWTGRMLPDGTVATVDPDSLRAKVRAAYFRRMAGIVVPTAQAETARALVPIDQHERLRNGRESDAALAVHAVFAVHSVSSLGAGLKDAALVEPWILPLDALRTPWHRRRVTLRWVAASVTVAILALITSILLPSLVWRRGPHAAIADDGRVVRVTFDGGARQLTIRPAGLAQFAQIGRRLPGDPAGVQRIVILADASDTTAATLSVHELHHGREVWSYRFASSGLPIEPLQDSPESRYSAKTAAVGDLDGDGDAEIVVSVCVHPWSSCLVRLFDDTATPARGVIHYGHIEQLLIADMLGDEAAEVLGVGLHARSSGLSVLLLRGSDFRSPVDSARTWDLGRQTCLAHLVIPRPPHLAEELGVLQLGFQAGSTHLDHRPGKPPLIRISAFVENLHNNVPKPNYIITLEGSTASVSGIVANARLVQAARDWIREGRAQTDFSSSGFIEEWRRSFRVFDHVDLDYQPTPDGGSE
jgi:hypothetical protein